MVVAPLNQQDVFAAFTHQIVNLVLVAAGVLDVNFVTGSFRSVDAHE